MKIESKKLPQSQVELNMEVDTEEIKPFLESASREIARGIKINGFRPGAAPRVLVERQVGRAQLWEEAVKLGLPSFLKEAFTEKKMDVLGKPQISILKIAPDNPLCFKVVAAVMPEVILGSYKNVKVAKPKVKKVTAKDTEALVKKLQETRAAYITVSREARKGDRVEIDFKCYLKNNLIEGGVSQNHPLILGQGQFVPGFEDQILGMKKGNEKAFNLRFPREYLQQHLAGRLARFQVKVNLVQEVKIPEINDQFAQSIGPRFTSLMVLKKKLRANLQTEAEMKMREKYELEVLDKVCASVKVEIPPVLLDAEKERMMQELKQDVEGQGGKLEDYLKSIKKSRADLLQAWDNAAEKRIKTSLVLREIARREKVRVADKEIEAEINEMLKFYPKTSEMKDKFENPVYRDYIQSLIRNKKVIKMLCPE